MPVYGLCPSCCELAWHIRHDDDSEGMNLYRCVKCGMFHDADVIPRLRKEIPMRPAAA